MLTIIIPIAVFIGVTALVGGVAMLIHGAPESAMEDRLDVLTSKAGGRTKDPSGRDTSVLAHPLDDV